MTDLPSGANTVTATFGDATDTVTFNVDPNGGIAGVPKNRNFCDNF